MKVWLELCTRGYPVDDVPGDEVRLDRGDPVAFDSAHVVEAFQEVEETFSGSPSEVPGVYTRDDYLLDSRLRNLPGLFQNLVNRDIP